MALRCHLLPKFDDLFVCNRILGAIDTSLVLPDYRKPQFGFPASLRYLLLQLLYCFAEPIVRLFGIFLNVNIGARPPATLQGTAQRQLG